MQDVRGGEKSSGEFRHSQNWIGPAGSTLKNARYIPQNQEDMFKAMSDLEKFINSEDELDPLIKIWEYCVRIPKGTRGQVPYEN